MKIAKFIVNSMLYVSGLFIILVVAHTHLKSDPYRENYLRFEEKIVSVHYRNNSYCSGYKLTDNIVVTASHCITPMFKAYNVYNEITGIEAYKLFAYDIAEDSAILINDKVTHSEIAEAKSKLKRDCSSAKVTTYGYPGKFIGLRSTTGYIRGTAAVNIPLFGEAISASMYKFEKQIFGGMSGGPVLSDGKLCGVNSAGIRNPNWVPNTSFDRLNKSLKEWLKNPGYFTTTKAFERMLCQLERSL